MTVYKYLGYGVTNESGVAKLEYNSEGQKRDHSYTGVGAGEIDVVASLDNPVESGSIVSETLPVLDTLMYDTGTDATHNIWTGSTSNLTRGSEYSRLEESTIGSMVQLNATMPTGLWVLTMTVKKDGNNGDWNINILNNNVSVFGCGTPANDTWTDITLVYDGSFISYFENGSTTPTKKTSVMLDESKTTILRLQTPQGITYVDFKDLIVLREGMSNISIGSSNPIIQSGDTATIKGSLYENGLPVQNATLDVYKNGTKVGTASTGESGVASYSYSGTGVGECEFQFKYGSILSETYILYDGTFKDIGITGQKSNYWRNNNAFDIDVTPNGTHITELTNASELMPSISENATAWNQRKLFDVGFAVEMDISNIVNYPKFRFYYGTSSANAETIFSTEGHYKFLVTSTGITVSINGGTPTVLTDDSISGQVSMGFVDTAVSSLSELTFKNFVVYPI